MPAEVAAELAASGPGMHILSTELLVYRRTIDQACTVRKLLYCPFGTGIVRAAAEKTLQPQKSAHRPHVQQPMRHTDAHCINLSTRVSKPTMSVR